MKILSKLFPEVKQTQQPVVEKKAVTSKYSYEDQKIKEMFEAKGETLTPEKMKEVQAFLSETEGTLESKLETLSQTMDKDIEITSENLKAVHSAVHQEIKVDMPLPEVTVPKLVQKLPKAVRGEVKELVDSGMSLAAATKSLLTMKLSETLFPDKEVPKEIPTEHVKESTSTSTDVSESIILKDVDTSTITESQERTTESVDYEPQDPIEFLEEVFEALSDSLEEVAEMILPVAEPAIFDIKSPVIKMIQTTMTEKMAETKDTFDMYQKAISNQLEQIIETPKAVPVKEILTQVIDKLDHIIMKTDVPLYTDMKTERDLLQSSGELELARNLVESDTDKAFEIIKDIKAKIDSIVYKPVKQKIFGVTQKVLVDHLYEEELIKSIPIKFDGMKSSPRAVLETLRGLGINHEAEVTDLLNRKTKELRAPANMKAILMKLEESTDHKIQSKDTLENLSGQQLLNKLEIKSHKQQLTFNLPVTIDSELKQIKIHVNAKKDNQKIDWKNSRLYFVIQLDKLGDTGVLVDVNNGNVNVTIKNDSPDIEKNMKDIVKDGLERLESVGFKASSIKFERLNEDKKEVASNDNFEVSL